MRSKIADCNTSDITGMMGWTLVGWLVVWLEGEVSFMKENAEGTYKTKHAEAARLTYTTTTHRHTDT